MKATKEKLLAMLMFVILCLSSCAPEEDPLDTVIGLIRQEDYAQAAQILQPLESAERSAALLRYLDAVQTGENGDFAKASSMLADMGAFLDSPLQATYYQARQAEKEKRWIDAQAGYESIALFRDSAQRSTSLSRLRWQAEYEQGILALTQVMHLDVSQASDAELAEAQKICSDTVAFLNCPLYFRSDDPNRTLAVQLGVQTADEQQRRLLAMAQENLQIVAEKAANSKNPYELKQAEELCRYTMDAIAGLTNEQATELVGSLAAIREQLKAGIMTLSTAWACTDPVTGKAGVMRADGTWIVPAEWEWTYLFSDGQTVVADSEKRYHLLDQNGKSIGEGGWDDLCVSADGGPVFLAEKEDRWLLYSMESGAVLNEVHFDDVRLLQDENRNSPVYYSCELDGREALMDENGKLLTDFEWDFIYAPSEELFRVEKDGNYGFIDTEGRTVISCRWKDVSDFHDGRALVERNDYNGYIDRAGQLVLPMDWRIANDFSEGLARVYGYHEMCWGFIDPDGNLVIDYQWEGFDDFFDGVAIVELEEDGPYGFINKQGRLVPSGEWDSIRNDYCDGVLIVASKGRRGLVSVEGVMLTECEMESINIVPSDVEGEYFVFLHQNGETKMYDLTSHTVVDCGGALYDRWYSEIGNGFVTMQRDGLWGIFDCHGREVVACEWDECYSVSNGKVLVCRGEELHVIDLEGNVLY